jgi:hypothetical protein
MAAAAPARGGPTTVPSERTWLAAPERAFLLGCLFHGALDLPRLRALASAGLDWEALVEAAGPLGLAGMLFDALESTGLGGALPPASLSGVAADAGYIAARNALHAHVAARVHRTLSVAGVASLALKGTAMAHHAPRYFSLRYQADLDVLIHPAEVHRAADLLRAAGYTDYQVGATMDGRLFGAVGQPRQLGHHLPPLISPESITVELHRELPGHLSHRFDDGVWARALQGGGPVGAVPSATDLLGILCAHVFGGHRGERRYLPRHVADLSALLAGGASLAEAERIYGAPVTASLRLLEETRAAVARPGRLWARGAEVVLAPPWWPWTRLWRALLVRGATLEGQVGLLAGVGLGALFPSPDFMAERYGVGRRSPLLPLTYLWRPVRALLRLVLGR